MRERTHLNPIIWIILTVFLTGVGWLYVNSNATTPDGLFTGIPVVVVLISIYFYNARWFAGALLFFIPVSIRIEEIGNAGMTLPAELMMLMLAPVLLYHFLKNGLPKKYLLHPLSLVVFLQIAWIIVTTVLSQTPVFSQKFLISRSLYIFTFTIGFWIFYRTPEDFVRALVLYLSGLLVVIVQTLQRHGKYDFDIRVSPWAPDPFFADHTLYAATLCLMIPPVIAYLVIRWKQYTNLIIRSAMVLVVLTLLVALFFSYSRAAWISAIISFLLFLTMKLRLGFRFWALAAVSFLLIAIPNFDQAYFESDSTTGLEDNPVINHVNTITNLSTYESNLERVNRWSCALAMWEERPWFGHGPASYESNYGAYQATSELTRISVFDGSRGDAHSEYLTALAEQGTPGLVLLLFQYVLLIFMGYRVWTRHPEKPVRLLAAGLLLALHSYFIHAFVNDFIEWVELGSLFWIFNAVLVIWDTEGIACIPDRIQR